jgi:hypothetical protein
MTATYNVNGIENIIEIGTTLSRSWFRGHAKVVNELTPKVFRKKFANIAKFREVEFSMVEAFKRAAPALARNTPSQNDHVSWQFLMQHHGTPTRLLDWTQSVLVALYFAVGEEPNEDGELWVMYPDELSKHSGFFGIALSNSLILRYLAAEPNHHSPQFLARELGLEKSPECPIPVSPPMSFPRIISQLSTFTIHPIPKPGFTIIDLLPDMRHLVRYIIPGKRKQRLLADSRALGITRHSLFPDLDALSESVIQECNIIAYSPPEPPKWGPMV